MICLLVAHRGFWVGLHMAAQTEELFPPYSKRFEILMAVATYMHGSGHKQVD